MAPKQLNIVIRDTIFDPSLPADQAKVHVREKDGKKHYKVWIYLEGNDLPYVESVNYTLHETFKEPVRSVLRSHSNPNCTLVIWTWGVFLVQATIFDKQGFTYLVSHQLTYDKQFPTDKERYLYEDADPDDASARPTLVSYS